MNAHQPGPPIAAGAEPIVVVDNLTKQYRRSEPMAVAGVSFKLFPGQVFGLLGPNGAGKSTIVKSIVGLTRPSSGQVRIFGSSPCDHVARARIGFAPEDPDFPKYLRADEVLNYFGRLLGLSAAERRERIPEVLEWTGLLNERRQVRRFSKGMKQRLALAQAILGKAELLILDEPTSDLDPLGRRDVRDLIQSLKEQGTTTLLNSHLLSEVELVCDTVAIVVHGRIVGEGAIHQVVPEGKTLEQVFIDLVATSSPGRTLPQFMSDQAILGGKSN